MSRLLDAESGEVLYARLKVADSFWRRAVGLLGRRSLDADEALLIRPCQSIHTFFMWMRIGVAFVDHAGCVVDVRDAVSPWRFAIGPKSSAFVVEFSPESQKLRTGQQIRID